MAEANLLSFKKKLSEIIRQTGWVVDQNLDPGNPLAQDDLFIQALSKSIGAIQKKLLDKDREFLEKFNPRKDLKTSSAFKKFGQDIQKNLGVMGMPARDTEDLLSALATSILLDNAAFKEEKEFLTQANRLFAMFRQLPQTTQDDINAALAEKGPPEITQKPAAAGIAAEREKQTGKTGIAPENEAPSKPWLSYPAPNALFPPESYTVLRENPPDHKAIHTLAEEALKRFVERAVEDGVASEVSRPAQYPAKGIMEITRGNVTRYYDTSNITAAMFGLYRNAQGQTIHFKPDLQDVGLAFEGLPIKGVPITLWPQRAYEENVDEMDPTDHNWGPTTYRRNRAAAFFFSGIDDLPTQDRNRIIYKMGHRLKSLDQNNLFFKADTYEAALEDARSNGRETGLTKEMEKLAHHNASAYAYFRLGTLHQDDPDNLTAAYNKSLEREYIPQRRKTVYEMDQRQKEEPNKEGAVSGNKNNNSLNDKFVLARDTENPQKPATAEAQFRDNVIATGLERKSDPSTSAPTGPSIKDLHIKL